MIDPLDRRRRIGVGLRQRLCRWTRPTVAVCLVRALKWRSSQTCIVCVLPIASRDIAEQATIGAACRQGPQHPNGMRWGMSRRFGERSLWGLITVILAMLACQRSQAARCVPGATAACACANGQTGSQVCMAEGTFAACECAARGNTSSVDDKPLPTFAAPDPVVGAPTDVAAPPTAVRAVPATRRGESASTLPETPDRSIVLAALQRLAPDIRACARGQVGSVRVIFVFGATGRVQTVSVQDLPAGEISSCIVRAAHRATLPPFRRPSLSVDFPYTLN